MGGAIDARRDFSAKGLEEIRARLRESEKLIRDKACVYITGSYGRGEASIHSDIDIFILADCTVDDLDPKNISSRLSNLDEILVKADLIRAIREEKLPEFSGDGKYLTQFPIEKLLKTLGRPEDDAVNTFTARLLFMLESKPLVGEEMYRKLTDKVISPYWRDYPDHNHNFSPAFLVNDILRLWRTLCVNYEATTESDTEVAKVDRKIKNYKLKYSRMITCFSAIIYLLDCIGKNDVAHPSDAKNMISLTPTERIEYVLTTSVNSKTKEALEQVISEYNAYLDVVSKSKEENRILFSNKVEAKKLFDDAYTFGDHMYNALERVGENSRLRRLITI